MCIFAVPIVARYIVTDSIAMETMVTRYVVADFMNKGSFVAEYIVSGLIFVESIVADSIVVKSWLQGPMYGFHFCGIHCC